MITLFKNINKINSKVNPISEVINPHKKSQQELIKEIHDTFFTEVNRLLESAKIANSLETSKNELIEKSERLKNLGFVMAREVKEASEEIRRLEKLRVDNDNKKELIEAINYFTFKYPHYKFITEESVKLICEKYNLVYGQVKNYIGDIPDENLAYMEAFQIEEVDNFYVKWYDNDDDYRIISLDEYERLKDPSTTRFISSYRISVGKVPLEIVAPGKDFIEHTVKNYKVSKIEVLDPVVLKPVLYKNKKYYLIVTAWGLEASDNMVMNPKHN